MYCVICHELIMREVNWSNLFLPAEEEFLCATCKEQLPIIEGAVCRKCHRPMEKDDICTDCNKWENDPKWSGVLEKNITIYSYTEWMQELIAKWKYRGDYMLVHAWEELWKAKAEVHFSKLECIYVPIPLSDERLRERGFNQAEALAKLLPSTPQNLLTRTHSEKQSKKKRHERISSENPFSIYDKVAKPVVIIDDIYTTGITLRHAAKLLKENGCPKVFSFTLIRS